MFLLIFESLSMHRISFVQHFRPLGRNIYMYVRFKFSFVRSSHGFCVRAPAHSLEGTVTFRPRSTSVAGTVSNADGFACCCRAANDEDGYRVGAGQGFELTAVAVGHLGRSATWR